MTTPSSDDRPDYGLDGDADAAVADLVDGILVDLREGEVTRREVLVRLSDGIYPLVDDDPDAIGVQARERILAQLDPALDAADFERLALWEF